MNDDYIKTEKAEMPEDRVLVDDDREFFSEEDIDWPETLATTPTHDYQVATKKYIDDKVGSALVKATGAEINAGTDDAKFVTPKAIADSNIPTPIFGGDGSDGAYTNDTGEIALGGAEVVVKNFSSITIDTQHHMTFSNPHANGTIIIIKCSGDCSIGTGTMIKLGNDSTGGQTGAAGGTGGAGNSNGDITGANGLVGTDPTGEWDTENDHGGDFGEGGAGLCGGSGGGGGQVANGAAGTGSEGRGTNGAAGTRQYYFVGFFNRNNQRKTYFVACGSGGGGGAGGSGSFSGTVGNGGNGGIGGGALVLEVAGNLTFTGTATIEAEGFNGEDGDNGGGNGSPRAGGGGGGGAGGTIVVLYKGTLTGSLTTSVIGGTGGTQGTRAGVCTDAGGGGNGAAGSYLLEKYLW